MEVNPIEAARGARWFYTAGTVAIVLAFMLFRWDEWLSNSDREKVLGETLKELRTAQASLGSDGQTDPRVHNSVPGTK